MAPVWPVIPQDVADDIDARLTRMADELDEVRNRCGGYPEAPLGELQRTVALLDRARAWFAGEAREKLPVDRVFAVLPRAAHEAATVEAIARAARVAPSTARRHLQALVEAGRACAGHDGERRGVRYYRNPLAAERTTNGSTT